MQKTKTKEKEIAKLLKAKNSHTEQVFKAMAFCMYVYDNMFGTKHFDNIKAIYFKYADESVIKIADKLKSNDRTLTRYRNRYLECMTHCDFAIKYFDEIFNFFN